MPNTISVSPAAPDKLVVNGVDLVNRDELSSSQQRELQRYIDANAHLLGYLDKEREENDGTINERNKSASSTKYTGAGASSLSLGRPPPTTNGTNVDSFSSAPIGDSIGSAPAKPYNSFSLDRGASGGGSAGLPHSSLFDDSSSTAYARPPSATQSLNRALGAGSPYSEYGGPGKRKGVSWSDVVDPSPVPGGRARSNSPPQNYYYRNSGDFSDSMGPFDDASRSGDYRHAKMARGRSPPYSTIDKHRTPYDQDSSAYWSPSPWGGSWEHATRRGGSKDREKPGWKGFAKTDLPTYSALERSQDDFNPFQTHLHREEALRKSQEKDEAIKFYGYGDHRVSGIEMQPRRWQGGEIVTDPNIMKKSIKPRRLFYSPIGDGVVEADGIEMKRPPPDLFPRRYVYHQRYVEQDPGQPGLKVIENIWHEGGPGDDLGDQRGTIMGPADDGPGKGRGRDRGPPDDDGLGRGKGDAGPPYGPPAADDGAGKKGPKRDGPDWPNLDDDGRRARLPRLDDGLVKPREMPPLAAADDDDGLGDARPASAVPSFASGPPREPWQITFIANPRECINIFGTEVNTNIFDLEDHTPKTITTIKETFSPARDMPPPSIENDENH